MKKRISGKNLGLFKLPYCCKADLYLELVVWNKDMPFRFSPPRLMNKLDAFQKNMVESYFDENGKLPRWLIGFKDVQECCQVGKLSLHDEANDITLTGIPDLVVRFKNGTYGVIDFKTAYRNTNGDPLRPIYEVQLNSYAYLLEAEGKEVSLLALAYFEGDTGFINDLPTHELVQDWGHDFQFFVFMDPITSSPSKLIPSLLKKASQLFDLKELPAPTEGCRNCEKLADYRELITGERPKLVKVVRDHLKLTDEISSHPSVFELWDPTEK